MGYDLHIERDEPITADEWRRAVAAAPALLRLMTTDVTVTNPATGERIIMPHRPLYTEVWSAADQRWEPVFRVVEDDGALSISFGARALEDPAILPALRHLVRSLEAAVVGDEGEAHDLD